MNIELTQNLFIEKVRSASTCVRTGGVAGKQDPTAWEKLECKMELDYGFSIPSGDVNDPEYSPIPEPEDVQVFITLCWGAEFRFCTSVGDVEGYFDDGWSRLHPRFIEVFKRLLLESEVDV